MAPSPNFAEAGPSYGRPSAPPPRRHHGLIIAVVVIIVILIAGVATFALLVPAGPPVAVGYINIYAPDNVCGLNSNPIAFYGYNSSTGASQTLDFGMPNYNATTCVIQSATTNTSGFVLSDIQVPLSIPANGTGSMNITITSPSSDYSGNMNLVLS